MRLQSWSFVIPCILALVATACSGAPVQSASSSSPSAAATVTAQPTAAGPVAVKVTTLALCNESYLYWGMEHGIFEKHGLKVETVKTQGGSAGIAAIVSGAADFSFTNGLTAILSFNVGFPIQIVAGAYESPQPPKPPSQALFVKPDSPVKSPKDLVGKKIGVNELGGINHIVTAARLRKLGVNPQDVNWVALPFPQIVQGVVQGRLDAGQAALANIGANDVRVLGDPFREGVNKVIFAAYLATNSFIKDHPGVSEKFQAAIAESIAAVEDPKNLDAQFALAAKNCGNDPKVLAKQPQQEYEAAIDMATMEDMGKLLIQEGYLTKAPDMTKLVPEFARKK